MKRILISVLILSFLFAFAKEKNNNDMYLNYVDKVVNYNFKIKDLKKLKTPFYVPKIYKSNMKPHNRPVKRYTKLKLLSILSDKAYIKVDVYLGLQLIDSYKKWLSLNQSVNDCKLIKLNFTKAVFKCNDGLLVKELNHKLKNLEIRERK